MNTRVRVRVHARSSSGFSLIELLVVIAIVTSISSVVLVRYADFNSITLLRSLAYDVALSVREAQTLGVGVQGGTTGTIEERFDFAYGVHFTLGTQYILFQDVDESGTYDSGEEVFINVIGNNHTISNLCAEDTCDVTTLDVVYRRPDLDASFSTDSSVSNPEYVQIELSDPRGGTSQLVRLSQTGQISVEAASD